MSETTRHRDELLERLRLALGMIAQSEQRLNLAHVAIEAAQGVIGLCNCIMAETSQDDPKAAWREARDAARAAIAKAEGSAE